MADAMEMMILSILAPALHCDWLLNEWEKALITTVVFCGMMLSGAFWGKMCDQYGRKSCLILCTLFTFYFGTLSAFSPIFIWLLILRLLAFFYPFCQYVSIITYYVNYVFFIFHIEV